MSDAANTLRDAAAVLLAKAMELDGGQLPSGFDMNNKDTWWPAMLKQFENDSKPHAYVPWGTGVLPEQSGTNEPVPASYESHKIMWEAAMRGDPVTPGGPNILTNGIPGWPDANGRPFRIFDHLPLGPEAIHAAIAHLYVSPTGQAWLASVGDTWPALRKQPTRW